jgi:hypothetical protein
MTPQVGIGFEVVAAVSGEQTDPCQVGEGSGVAGGEPGGERGGREPGTARGCPQEERSRYPGEGGDCAR